MKSQLNYLAVVMVLAASAFGQQSTSRTCRADLKAAHRAEMNTLSTYADLQKHHDELQSEHTALLATYAALQEDYKSLAKNRNDFQIERDKLLADYNALVEQHNSLIAGLQSAFSSQEAQSSVVSQPTFSWSNAIHGVLAGSVAGMGCGAQTYAQTGRNPGFGGAVCPAAEPSVQPLHLYCYTNLGQTFCDQK